MFCSNCILSSFLFKHFHNLFIIVSKLLQVWPRFYVFATIALLVSSWLQTFSYQIYNFHCSTFLTKIGAALVHFDVFFWCLQQLLYWSLLSTGSGTMLLFCSVLNNRGKVSTNTKTKTKTNTNRVWSILMFIVYAAIALLALLGCRHCPSCTPCQTSCNRGKEQVKISKCQNLRVEILYLVVYVLYRLINVQTRLPFFGK